MRLYIFRSVKNKYSIPFRLFAINQNLKVARFSALLVMVVCFVILISGIVFDYSFIPNSKFYLYGFLFMFGSSVVYFVAAGYLKKIAARRRLILKRIIGSSYAMVIVSGMMWMSFVSGSGPANNMTIFMFGLLFVSISWLFSINGATLISLLTFALLSAGLNFFLADTTQLLVNHLAGAIIIIGFYFISRLLYSYHANYFMQLKLIERKNHEIKKMDELKTEMLGIVAHDLRGPINSITALVDLTRTGTLTDNEREEYSGMILEACDEARNIIRDLITVVKGESAQSLQLKEVNMNHFLKQVQQHWAHQVSDNKKIQLQVPGTILIANIDEDKMLRVLDNLINNAIKFTNENGVIALELGETANKHIKIVVSDNGIGIPEDIQPYMFERFSKAGRLGLKGEKSHGLGLNICKQIVEHHGGKVTFESAVGHGTSFFITIPAEKTPGTEKEEADMEEMIDETTV